jgi:hypothetical protein
MNRQECVRHAGKDRRGSRPREIACQQIREERSERKAGQHEQVVGRDGPDDACEGGPRVIEQGWM